MGTIEYRRPILFSTTPIELDEVPCLTGCNSCKSWFTQHVVPESEALDLYRSGDSNAKWPRQIPFIEEKSANIVSRLNQYFLEGSRVLDVGCNTGSLLDFARLKGCLTHGVEPSISSQSILTEKGHVVFSSTDAIEGKFDVITAFDLVEHLYDLSGFITRMHGLLTKGGVLILLTGDIASRSARLAKQNWWYLKAPEHIVFPSQSYLKNFEGYQLLTVDQTYASRGYKKPYMFSVAQLVRKTVLGSYDGLPPLGPDHMLVVLAMS
ncbi:MAG: class I SAM-dependent methyltransferase [Sideroxydans sp.]|jgi:SAM-dependent methyltransferase